MANRNITPKYQKNGLYTRIELGETVLTSTDTITLNGFKATANPWFVTVVKKSDGTEATITYAAGTNVVTITAVGANVECWYFAYGVKA